MAKQKEKEVAVARVYSRSMLDLAEAQGQAEALLDEMRELMALVERDEAFHRFLTSPLVDEEKRRDSLEKTLRGRASDLLVDSLQVLNQNGRLELLGTLVESYRAELKERQGRVDVEVTSAVPLTDALRQQLAAAVSKLVGREGDLVEEVDPSLIGGMVVRIGDRKIDTSVAKDLRELRARLEERAGQEIYAHRSTAAD